jgi:hypothetical protein
MIENFKLRGLPLGRAHSEPCCDADELHHLRQPVVSAQIKSLEESFALRS